MAALITVVIPAYNAAATLDETLKSVRSQSYHDIEILIVDDGSSDETPRIVLRHAAADDRVRLIRQANQGVAAARNRGIAEARGELIAPVDADDLWASTKLEKQIATITASGPAVGLVYCWYAIIDAEGLIEGIVKPNKSGKLLSCICENNLVGNGSSPLMRKDVVLAAGGYSTQLHAARSQGCEDWLLYMRIAEKQEFQVVEECLVGYRQLPGRMSRDGPQMLRSFRLASGEILERNPDQSRNLLNGDFNLSAWLFRRAVIGKRLWTAAYLAASVAMKHPKRFASSFIPEMVQRSLAALYRWVRQVPKDRFVIGSALESQYEIQATCPRSTSSA